MLTVFTIGGNPEHIYFCKSQNFDQLLMGRGLEKEDVMSQEISLETLMLLAENKSKVFILCLYKSTK